MELIAILAIPAIAAAVSLMPWGKGRAAVGGTVVGAAGVLIVALDLACKVVSSGVVVAVPHWLACDGLSALVVLLVAFTNLGASLFSWGYMRSDANDAGSGKTRRYYARYNLLVLSMLAVPVLSQVAMVWIATELTTLVSVFLVSHDNTPESLEAAWKYAVLTCLGATIALFGVLLLYHGVHLTGGGPFTWDVLAAAGGKIPAVLLKTAFVFVLLGFGTKVGLVPMHTWLPDAYSRAPAPICALFSTLETASLMYVLVRMLPVFQTQPILHAGSWYIAFGLLSAGVAALLILQVKDCQRLFAFSTIEHAGVILVAVGLSGSAAQFAASYQIASHVLAKSFCFFAAGLVILATGSREIASVRGLIRTSPAAAAALLVAGLAIAGTPPFTVFLSEFSILKAGLAGGHYAAVGLLTLFIVIAFCGVMYHVTHMVFGTSSSGHRPRHLPISCVVALCLTGVPLLWFGLSVPGPVHQLLQLAASSLGR